MNYNENQYLDLLSQLVNKYNESQFIRNDRTGIGTISMFGKQMEFDLTNNQIPLLTTKKINLNTIIYELIWMYILGNKDTSYLDENKVKIWSEWTVYNQENPNGTIGRMYGQILRKGLIDQVQEAIDILKRSPKSRRALFSSWDPTAAAKEDLSFEENVEQNRGVLNPCHGLMTQLYINDNNELEMFTFQRSADIFLGLPFNIVFYSILTLLIARELNIKASKLVYSLGDVHLYSNHIEQAKLQLSRVPFKCPSIVIDKEIKRLDDLKDPLQIKLINYQHHPFIKAQVAI